MQTLEVHSVLGAVSSGKSMFIDKRWNTENAVIMRIGSMLRGCIGTSAMTVPENSEDYKNAPEISEEFARFCAEHGRFFANRLNRPLVLDGFPRSVLQAKWFVHRLMTEWQRVQPVDYHVHVICPSREELLERIEAGGSIEKEFDLYRLDESIRQLDRVLDIVQCRQTVIRSKRTEKASKFQRKITIHFGNRSSGDAADSGSVSDGSGTTLQQDASC